MILSRRYFLGTLVASAIMPLPALAQSVGGLSGIFVDNSELAAKGNRVMSGRVAQALQQELEKVLANKINPRDSGLPRLVVQLDQLYFTSDESSDFLSSDSDFMGGRVSLVRGRQTLQSFHQEATSNAALVGVWYLPNQMDMRINQLVENYAGWIQRKIGQ